MTRTFRSLDASHVVSEDGGNVHIEFLDGQQIEYRNGERRLIVGFEAFFKPTGVPDGSILDLKSENYWSDGKLLTESERAQIFADFQAAAVPLLTRFYLR